MNQNVDPSQGSESRPSFYVQRGQKVFGPFSANQIARGQAEGKFRLTDKISESASGPWAAISDIEPHPTVVAVAIATPEPHEEIITATVVDHATLEAFEPVSVSDKHELPILSPVEDTIHQTGWHFLYDKRSIYAASGILLMLLMVAFWNSGKRPTSKLTEQASAAESNINQPFEMTTADWDSIKMEGATNSTVAQQSGNKWEPGPPDESFDDFLNRMIGDSSNDKPKASTPTISYTPLPPELDRLSAEDACNLANEYLYGDESGPKETSTAFRLLAKASNQGNAKAMLLLSACYSGGWGVEANERTSLYWVEQAAIHRCPEAMYWYAALIKEGGYPGKGQSECLYWLTESARAAYQPAIVTLEDFKKRQIASLVGGALLSAFTFGGAESSSPDENQERWNRREREREYWNERARNAAANRDYKDLEYSADRGR